MWFQHDPVHPFSSGQLLIRADGSAVFLFRGEIEIMFSAKQASDLVFCGEKPLFSYTGGIVCPYDTPSLPNDAHLYSNGSELKKADRPDMAMLGQGT